MLCLRYAQRTRAAAFDSDDTLASTKSHVSGSSQGADARFKFVELPPNISHARPTSANLGKLRPTWPSLGGFGRTCDRVGTSPARAQHKQRVLASSLDMQIIGYAVGISVNAVGHSVARLDTVACIARHA